MTDRSIQRSRWSDRLAFLGQFLRSPMQVASVAPSTRFVERRIARCVAGVSGTIVELGAGTGGVTRAILSSISGAARLVAVELNPVLARRVAQIRDGRLVVRCRSAEDLPEILGEQCCGTPSAIVSGLPFSTIPHARAVRILDAIERSLAPGGEFVAYHARNTLERLVDARDPSSRLELVDESFEWRSIPPLWIYRWRKPAGRVSQVPHAPHLQVTARGAAAVDANAASAVAV